MLWQLLAAASSSHFFNDVEADSFITGTHGFKLLGTTGNYGIAVSDCGDVNGDNIDDTISCGTIINNDRGTCFVIMGSNSTYSADVDLVGFVSGVAESARPA